MAALDDNLRALRPDLNWGRGERVRGDRAARLRRGDRRARRRSATSTTCSTSSARSIPGATLDDVDVEAVERTLGRDAADDVRRLQELERELRRQGWVTRDADGLTLSPKALRRLGGTALRTRLRRPDRRAARASTTCATPGAAGEVTGASRRWEFGDEQPLDVVRTVDPGGPPRPAPARAGAARRSRTSRWSRPSAGPRRRWRSASTCRTR